MSKAIITESGKVGFIIGSGNVKMEYTNPNGSIDPIVEEFQVEITKDEAVEISNLKSRKDRLKKAKGKMIQ